MRNQPFTRLPALLASFALLAGCASAAATPVPRIEASPDDTSAIRALGPATLDKLLARWDAMPAGPAREVLAATIDRVASQRYATVSRMYWHTNLEQAKAAAKAEGKPILSLRMLGRLDEDLSCANSRLFRTTLYANKDVSKFLRDNFILHWSSERDVPRVTIDFGEGRKIVSTTTGNSAHYVLAGDGTVLDALPGVYAPVAFMSELEKSLGLARTIAKLQGSTDAIERYRADVIEMYHRDAIAANARRWAAVDSLVYLPDRGLLLGKGEVAGALAMAQRATISKAYIEVPALARIASTNPGQLLDDATDAWAAIGQFTWKIGDAWPEKRPARKQPTEGETIELSMLGYGAFIPGQRGGRVRNPALDQATVASLPKVLDEPSRALVAALHDGGPVRASMAERNVVIARLEHHLVADTALNQFKLRAEIHQHLVKTRDRSFEHVNGFIYGKVFHTPREDAWLGLLPRTDFTGLPGDGVVMP